MEYLNELHRYVDHQRLHIVTKDVISLSISVLLLFRHYISHKITFGAPSSGGVLCSACGAFIIQILWHFPQKKDARPIWVKYVQLSLSIISISIHPYVCMPAAKALIRLHRGPCAGSSEPWLPTHAKSTKILVRLSYPYEFWYVLYTLWVEIISPTLCKSSDSYCFYPWTSGTCTDFIPQTFVLFEIRYIQDQLYWEHSGSVVECLTRDRRVAGLSLTRVTALWSFSKAHLS